MAYKPKFFNKRARSSRRRQKKSARKPVRFSKRSKNYFSTAKLSRAVANLAETEHNGAAASQLTPNIFSATNPTFYKIMFNLGHDSLSGATHTELNMFNVAMPDDTNNYRFIKRNLTNFEIKMESMYTSSQIPTNMGPLNFRFLILSPIIRSNLPSLTPNSELWMDESGKTLGMSDNANLTTLDLHSFILNRKKFKVLQDRKFTLSRPTYTQETQVTPTVPGNLMVTNGSTNQSRYDCQKYIKHTQVINKKVYYGDRVLTNAPPLNLSDNYYVLCYAYNVIDGSLANGWRLSYKTTTSYTDM